MSATDINHAMGHLYIAVAQDRIPVRRANTLARIGGSLLRSVKDVKTEFTFKYSFEQWKNMQQNAAPLSTPDSSQSATNPPISIDTGITQPSARTHVK